MSTARMSFHQKQLDLRCRVCGRQLDTGSKSHKLVSTVTDALLTFTGVDARRDSPSCHPSRLCSACWKFVERSSTAAAEESLRPLTSFEVAQKWPVCVEDSCELCEQWRSERTPGRPKKRKWGGRPKESERYKNPLQATVGAGELHSGVATRPSSAVDPSPLSHLPPAVAPSSHVSSVAPSDHAPSVAPSSHVSSVAPSSHVSSVAPSSHASSVVPEHPGDLAIADVQSAPVAAQSLPDVQEKDRDLSTSVGEVLQAPVSKPISDTEDRLLGGLLRRLSYQHQSMVGLPIFTGGRKRRVSYLPAATAGSSSASQSTSLRTLQRRQKALHSVEESVSGGSEGARAQRVFNVAHSQEREKLIVDARICYHVPPDESMAMATHLRLSHEQHKKLRQWTKKWNLHLASERRTQAYAVEQMGDVEIGSEMVQVATSMDGGVRELRKAAFAWVKNPITLLQQHLANLHKRDLMTWHKREPEGPSLPEDEIWVKIGGDKGGSSFKMAMQIVNQQRPNSADHTVAFSCLEADDTISNLHVCLDYFKQAIHEMQELQWR